MSYSYFHIRYLYSPVYRYYWVMPLGILFDCQRNFMYGSLLDFDNVNYIFNITNDSSSKNNKYCY